MFSLRIFFALFTALLVTFSVTGSASAKSPKLKVTPTLKSVQLDDEIDFRVLGSKRRCKVSLNGQGVGVSYSSKRGTRFSWAFQDEGAMSFKVRCGKSRTSFTVQVVASSDGDDGEETGNPDSGSPAAPAPTPPARLTGSDAEAERHWQSVRHFFANLERGWCADYAYSRRPDIAERVEKAAYKQWVADGAPIFSFAGGVATPTGQTATQWYQFIDARNVYSNWGNLPTSDARNAWVAGARRAGLTVDHIPSVGDIEVTRNHVRVVERLLPPTDVWFNGAYEYTEMSASNPGVVARGVQAISEPDFRAGGKYFVG